MLKKHRSSGVRREETLYVKAEIFPLIHSGQKNLEVRLVSSFTKGLYCGQIIKVASRTDALMVRIKAIRRYRTFKEMLQGEHADRIMPGQSAEEILIWLNAIYGREKERFGVYVFEFTIFT